MPVARKDDCTSVARSVLGSRVKSTFGPAYVDMCGTPLIPVVSARAAPLFGNTRSVYGVTGGPHMGSGIRGMGLPLEKSCEV